MSQDDQVAAGGRVERLTAQPAKPLDLLKAGGGERGGQVRLGERAQHAAGDLLAPGPVAFAGERGDVELNQPGGQVVVEVEEELFLAVFTV